MPMTPTDVPYDIAYVEYGYNYASPLGYDNSRVEPKICLLDRSGESVNHPKVRASSVRASTIDFFQHLASSIGLVELLALG